MTNFVNLSIRNKILFIAIVGGLGLSVNIFYTHSAVTENSYRLENIKNIYFPVIEKADASITYLDKINHLFAESITSGETIFIDSAEVAKDKMHEVLMGIATISPEKNSIMIKLTKDFDAYYVSNKKLAEGIISGKLQSIALKIAVDNKNTTLKTFEESLFNFRNKNFKKFSSMIEETDLAAQNSLDISIIVFIIVVWLLMFSTLAVISTLNESFSNVINSLKNMAKGKVKKFTLQKSIDNNAIPKELIMIEEVLDSVTKRFIKTEKEVWELNHSLQEKVDDATSRLMNVNKQLEGAVKNANQANKAKSAFLANMSHELRTPMNAIIGYGELMEDDINNKEYQNIAADIKSVRTASKHLLSLISDILDLSKIEAGKMDFHPVPFDIVGLTHEIEATIKPLMIENNNKYTLNLQISTNEMFSDLVKLKQILLNLLSNACKFTHDGEITLSVSSYYQNKIEYVDFEVTDSGIGIATDKIKNLFESFTQADSSTTRNFGGTGLGLAISRRYAQIMGGDIQAESRENIGSKFTLTMPLRFAAEMAS
jgi:signal transduction histidine kinase